MADFADVQDGNNLLKEVVSDELLNFTSFNSFNDIDNILSSSTANSGYLNNDSGQLYIMAGFDINNCIVKSGTRPQSEEETDILSSSLLTL